MQERWFADQRWADAGIITVKNGEKQVLQVQGEDCCWQSCLHQYKDLLSDLLGEEASKDQEMETDDWTMKNKNYIKGVKKERLIPIRYGFKNMTQMNKNSNYIIARSAGSHSKIDVWVIIKDKRKIDLYQCKPENYTRSDLLYDEQVDLQGTFEVEFIVK